MARMQNPILLRDVWEPCQCPGAKCRCGHADLPQVGDEVDPRDIADLPRVFAVDPGTHTGWACLWFDPDILFDPNVKVAKAPVAWWAGQFNGDEIMQVDLLMKLLTAVLGGDGMAVVIEDFVVRSVHMEETFLSPVRIGHMLRYGMHLGAKECDGNWRRRNVAEMASASDAKNVITDSRLKLWQTYLPGPDHPRDATRHAHLWLRRVKAYGEAAYERAHFVDEE